MSRPDAVSPSRLVAAPPSVPILHVLAVVGIEQLSPTGTVPSTVSAACQSSSYCLKNQRLYAKPVISVPAGAVNVQPAAAPDGGIVQLLEQVRSSRAKRPPKLPAA